ncbi:hypothetical protein GO003_019330 [Methylicorpusculum oleiharenae]|uniref:hypothetical protein n=1 Tax=Methylicorpusculum oleiharenae TaxID=1338687 RepID=UPI001E2E8597|nr:hypothetical protein [Methylicorpusculum oleiharenae]MCD2452541.1 hypothetical protein [Methylicorpusculum oleiharenae]
MSYLPISGGDLLETEHDVSKNRITLEKFQSNPFRLRMPLTNPEGFYRHYVELIDDPKTLDRMTSMLCSICKFARYE